MSPGAETLLARSQPFSVELVRIPAVLSARDNNRRANRQSPKAHIIVFNPPRDPAKRSRRCSGRETTSSGTIERF